MNITVTLPEIKISGTLNVEQPKPDKKDEKKPEK